jgi:superfamily I DNA/RNA helicase
MLKSSMADWESRSDIRDIIDQYNIEFDGIKDEEMAIDMLPTIKNMCMDVSVVDFDDMIWLPVVLGMPVEHYDTVFVDEAQDFNEVQRQLILKACNGGRMIVVGDPKQAIYGFRGADSASMDIFRTELEKSSRNVDKYTLSITWRCPTSVVDEAKRFFTDYNARDDAPEGTVNVNAPFTPEAGDLVLCRVNAPLVSQCFALITQGIPAYVLGRDIGYSLQTLVKKVTADSSMSLERFLPALREHVDRRISALKLQEKDNQIQSLNDKHDCILALAGNVNTVAGILDNIKEIFGEQGRNSGVVFSTIHKAKGLEAKTVWILQPELMPHPMAKSKSEREQEKNLCYVAITRAMETLNYVGDPVG